MEESITIDDEDNYVLTEDLDQIINRMCHGKIVYRSRKKAQTALININNRRKNYRTGLRIYECSICEYYHLGHR